MSAGEVDVRVLGTKFNLKSYAEDSEVEVTLVEGSVEMETKLGGDDRIVRLRPGELVKLDKRTGSTETFDVPTFVNGESLDEMLASFNADEAMRIRREGRIVNITKR